MNMCDMFHICDVRDVCLLMLVMFVQDRLCMCTLYAISAMWLMWTVDAAYVMCVMCIYVRD